MPVAFNGMTEYPGDGGAPPSYSVSLSFGGADENEYIASFLRKAMEMDDVEVSELDGAAAEHALNASDWPGAAPESVGTGGHVGAEAGGKAAERDGAASPPTWQMCLPTGNVIDDGTFCPDDELFLQARPPVKSLLRGVEEAAGGGDGGRGGRNSRDDDDDAGLGLRLELSPLSTMLTGASLERARQQCAAAALPAAAAAEAGARGGGDHAAPPASQPPPHRFRATESSEAADETAFMNDAVTAQPRSPAQTPP